MKINKINTLLKLQGSRRKISSKSPAIEHVPLISVRAQTRSPQVSLAFKLNILKITFFLIVSLRFLRGV